MSALPMEVVREALERHDGRPRGNDTRGYEARCPAHEDRSPSLAVSTGRDGRVLLHCHAGCDAESVVTALGLEWADLFPEDRRDRADRVAVAEYTYYGADGGKLFQVVRFVGKDFRQRRWTGHDWTWGMDGVARQLFRLPEVLRAKERGEWIFLCEGEKDALAVTAKGMCGTCNPGGAGKWEPQYTETLRGAKVAILADDDGAEAADPHKGLKHAKRVAQELYGKVDNSNVFTAVRLPAEGYKDISDHLRAGLSMNGDLRKVDVATDPRLGGDLPPLTRGGAMSARVFATTAVAPNMDVMGPLFQRSARTVIGAQTGEGKTTLALQAVKSLVTGTPFLEEDWKPRAPGRALLIDLEQGRATLQRRLAESGLDASERVDVLWEPSGIALDSREEDRAWVHDVLREGNYDLVVVDPLYQLHGGSGNDELVAGAVMGIVDQWVREFNCAFLIPMHMRKPHPDAGSKITKHDIAGSGSWLRPIEVVLGLQVMSPGNSRLWFFKDRNGEGPPLNSHWWMSFAREEGFKRTKQEVKNAVMAELRGMLQQAEGVTKAELLAVENANDTWVQDALKRAHEEEGRYRNRPWSGVVGQSSLLRAAE